MKKIGICSLLALSMLCGCSAKQAPKQVKLISKIEYSVTGEDGEGKFHYECWASTKEKDIQDFLDTIHYTASPKEGLSNGDEVKIKAKYDKDLAKKENIQVSKSTKKIRVKGLKNRTASTNEETDSKVKFSELTNTTEFLNALKEEGIRIGEITHFTQQMIDDEEIVGVLDKAYFEDADFQGETENPNAYLTGGTIEICEDEEQAQNRLQICNSIHKHEYEYNYVFKNIFIRLDKNLSMSEIQKYEAIFDEMNDVTNQNSASMREEGL